MTALRIWLRRSLALRLAPLLVGLLVLMAWTRDGWQYEWLFGARTMIGALPLVSALVAGAVAYDVVRHWEPLVAELGPSTRRWRRATLALVGAHVLWALAGVTVVLAAAAVRMAANDALGRPDAWLPFEVAAALAAAASVGLVAGMFLRSPVAPPLVAVAVFSAQALNLPFGLDVLFAPVSAVSSALGVERDPGAAAMTIALNLGVAAVCCALALRGARPSAPWSVTVAALAAGMLALLAVPASVTALPYRAQSTETVCITRGQVEVCGGGSAPLLADLASGLDDATTVLQSSQLGLPRSWTLSVPGTQPPSSQATAQEVSPAKLADERRTATLAAVLSQPRPCPQLYDTNDDTNDDTTALLERQQQVREWIEQALHQGRSGVAPAQVLSAYEQLAQCRPRL